LLITWRATDTISYLADLSSGKVHRVASGYYGHSLSYYPQDEGNLAIVIRLHPGFSAYEDLELLDLSTGSIETIYDPEVNSPQWAGPEEHKGDEPAINTAARWAGKDTVIATLLPYGARVNDKKANDYIWTREGWGRVFLADVKSKDVRVLMERGQVSAILPDGTLIMRSGWLHDETQVLRPPYLDAPEQIAPAGPWTWGWRVSPDGHKVAWLEMTPPPGDWSALAPWDCCDDSAHPAPIPNFIVVWNSVDNKVTRYPVTNYAWSEPHSPYLDEDAHFDWSYTEQLDWSRDGASIFYATHPDSEHTALHRLDLDGQLASLVVYEGRLSLKVVAEGNDKSIFYQVNKSGCQRCLRIERRYPNGTFQVVQENSIPFNWTVDERGRLIDLTGNKVSVYDLYSGKLRHAIFRDRPDTWGVAGEESSIWDISLSPDGRRVAAAADNSNRVPIDILTLKTLTGTILSKGLQAK
jgi:hypothetical protein